MSAPKERPPVPETVSAVEEANGKTEAMLDVAVKYPARAFIPRSEDPLTESVLHGDVVPIPKEPVAVMTDPSVPVGV